MGTKKKKGGQLLSQYLRKISEEVTECITEANGDSRMVSKAEALAYMIWKDALGHKQQVRGKDNVMVETIIAPVRAAQNIIFDRTEGRVPNISVEGADKLTAADKISEQGLERIQKAGGMSDKKD